MSIAIAASIKDEAALNIADKLIHRYEFVEIGKKFDGRAVYKREDVFLVFSKADSIFAGDLDQRLGVKEVIFVSRHKGVAEKPSLLVHVPGNLGDDAPFGGRPREIAWANPQRVKALLLSLLDHKGEAPSYSIGLEATHHGPTEMEVPVTFCEIGSSKDNWTDGNAGFIVAEAVWKAIKEPSKSPSGVGFGGTHYAQAFLRVMVEQDIAIGHIVPKYFLDSIGREMIRELLRKNWTTCKCAVIDWKGIRGSVRRALIDFLEEEDVEIVRV